MGKGKPAADISGQRFDRLIVVSRVGTASGQATWNCACDCGAEVVTTGRNLRSGHTRSCGCLSREMSAERAKAAFTKHGHFTGRKSSQVHNSYQAMIARCTDPNHPAFARYGGRGITICKRWREGFDNFLADMGEPAAGNSIDRIDNDGPYSPENCRWATDEDQNNNASRNRIITHDGMTLTLAQWSDRTGIPYVTLRWRLNAGWDVAKAFATPIRPKATRKPFASA